MSESVRLVVWDLDETFWRGTLSEGGLREYVQAHHNAVIELAHRGIMSSVCSKNDKEPTLQLLNQMGIGKYFIFPSISWEPKGSRLKQLIENIQLRPETVMFIDDNHGNRAEAASFVPGIQVESETFIADMLEDIRFKGRDDSSLSRLAQYKLLERRKRDEKTATRDAGGNEEFLRGCDIRVYIEHNVQPYVDRAIELINRTNQLNFTKHRLPEAIDAARQELGADLGDHFTQCGLVRVVDNYGDYGFVGFYALQQHDIDAHTGHLKQRLKHYCFSCRTLGMLVEKWLFDQLRQPHLTVEGEVLTDLFVSRSVDWIRQVSSLDAGASAVRQIAPEIRVHGGCEANAVAHYLSARTGKMAVTGNFHAANAFFRVNSASILMSACDQKNPEFAHECATLGVPFEALTSSYFDVAVPNTLFVFGGQLDHAGNQRLRHNMHAWELHVAPHGLEGRNFLAVCDDDLVRMVDALGFSAVANARVLQTARHLRDNYTSTLFENLYDFPSVMDRFAERLPPSCRLVLMTDHNRVRVDEQTVIDAPWAEDYDARCRAFADGKKYVGVACFKECVTSDNDVHVGGNHYDRMVYLRMADLISKVAAELAPK